MVILLVAVVVTADAGAVVRRADEDVRPQPGTLLMAEDRIDSGPAGWVELGLVGRGRLRLAAASQVILRKNGLEVIKGRVWIERRGFGGKGYRVQAGALGFLGSDSSSVLVEVNRSVGSWMTVISGQAEVHDGTQALVTVPAGHELLRPPEGGGLRGPRPGGTAVHALMSARARVVIGAEQRLTERLLKWAAAIQPATTRERAPERRLGMRAGAEVLGADGGPAGMLLEESLRPPPFGEEEIPPRGRPNVRVEVDFED